MSTMPLSLKENWSKTVLGRLKLELLKEVSKKDNYLPDPFEIKSYILKAYRNKAAVGQLLLHINTLDTCQSRSYTEIPLGKADSVLFEQLHTMPLDNASFVEVTNCPSPLPSNIGVLVQHHELLDHGRLYTVTIFNDQKLSSFIGRIEVAIEKQTSQSRISNLESGEFVNYDLSDYQNNLVVDLSLAALNILAHSKSSEYVKVNDSHSYQFDRHSSYKPPLDMHLMNLLDEFNTGEIASTEAMCTLSMIRPYSLPFCMAFPIEVVKRACRQIGNGNGSRLLVYWNESSFVMSDDYAHYLAYRSLGYEEVPVTVIGSFPTNLIKISDNSPAELPPLWTTSYTPRTAEFTDADLDRHLQSAANITNVNELYAIFMGLCDLLQDPHIKERQLHNYILRYPIILDPHIQSIKSEVRLGNEYRIDLVGQYQFDDKRILLVELERANLPLFTASGSPKAHVTHAYQQVEDWLRWWHENPGNVPQGLDSTIQPHGLVVIGRSNKLDQKTKKRLLSLNSNRKVQLLTYDDLLDRLENLISNLEVGTRRKTKP